MEIVYAFFYLSYCGIGLAGIAALFFKSARLASVLLVAAQAAIWIATYGPDWIADVAANGAKSLAGMHLAERSRPLPESILFRGVTATTAQIARDPSTINPFSVDAWAARESANYPSEFFQRAFAHAGVVVNVQLASGTFIEVVEVNDRNICSSLQEFMYDPRPLPDGSIETPDEGRLRNPNGSDDIEFPCYRARRVNQPSAPIVVELMRSLPTSAQELQPWQGARVFQRSGNSLALLGWGGCIQRRRIAFPPQFGSQEFATNYRILKTYDGSVPGPSQWMVLEALFPSLGPDPWPSRCGD